MTDDLNVLNSARVRALFSSSLSAGVHPTGPEVAAAIRDSVRAHGGTRGCACEVAAAYGDHPDLAVARMRWARRVVRSMYPPRAARVR